MDIRKKLAKHQWDAVAMATLLIVSLLFYYSFIPAQIRLRASWGGHTNFSSRTFPNLLMIGIFICSVIGLAKSIASIVRLRAAMRAAGPDTAARDTSPIIVTVIPYITYGLVLAYCLLFRQIGFIYSTLIIPTILMIILGCRTWYLYASTYAFAALLYVVFKILMHVPLP